MVMEIEPSRGCSLSDFKEIWQYREVLLMLSWRDLKIRYRQTLIGIAWAVIQPLLTMLILTVALGHVITLPSETLPYSIFSYSALLLWAFFSTTLNRSANSILLESELIHKVYFPRLLIPLIPVLAGWIDFAFGFCFLLVLVYVQGFFPGWRLVWVPVFLLLTTLAVLGFGFWLAALNARYRDIMHALPFLLQAWLFATPVVYPLELLAEPWQTLAMLNPMTGIVEGFRWALWGTWETWPAFMLGLSGGLSLALFLSGALYFKWAEDSFVDIV